MLEKFQPIKIAKRSYWLNAFLTKSKSILTENVNIINIIVEDRIGEDTIIFFSFFRKLGSLKYYICSNPLWIRHYFHSSASYLNGQY